MPGYGGEVTTRSAEPTALICGSQSMRSASIWRNTGSYRFTSFGGNALANSEVPASIAAVATSIRFRNSWALRVRRLPSKAHWPTFSRTQVANLLADAVARLSAEDSMHNDRNFLNHRASGAVMFRGTRP